MSPATRLHGPKLVALPHVPITWCEVWPVAGATAIVPFTVNGEFETASHDGIVSPTEESPPPLPGHVIQLVVPDDTLKHQVPFPGVAKRWGTPDAPPTIRSAAAVIGFANPPSDASVGLFERSLKLPLVATVAKLGHVPSSGDRRPVQPRHTPKAPAVRKKRSPALSDLRRGVVAGLRRHVRHPPEHRTDRSPAAAASRQCTQNRLTPDGVFPALPPNSEI